MFESYERKTCPVSGDAVLRPNESEAAVLSDSEGKDDKDKKEEKDDEEDKDLKDESVTWAKSEEKDDKGDKGSSSKDGKLSQMKDLADQIFLRAACTKVKRAAMFFSRRFQISFFLPDSRRLKVSSFFSYRFKEV